MAQRGQCEAGAHTSGRAMRGMSWAKTGHGVGGTEPVVAAGRQQAGTWPQKAAVRGEPGLERPAEACRGRREEEPGLERPTGGNAKQQTLGLERPPWRHELGLGRPLGSRSWAYRGLRRAGTWPEGATVRQGAGPERAHSEVEAGHGEVTHRQGLGLERPRGS